MELEDLRDLNQAAEELGIAAVTLRAAIARGRFNARKIGNAWITTVQEIARYRRENLGRLGRPAMEHRPGNLLEHVDLRPVERNMFDVQPEPGLANDNLLTKGRAEPTRRR